MIVATIRSVISTSPPAFPTRGSRRWPAWTWSWAEAAVDGDVLAVRFETAGPVETVPTPTFVVAQGDPLQPFSFELRLTRELDRWEVTLVTWPDAREKRQLLTTPVVAEGSTVSVEVPLDAPAADRPVAAVRRRVGGPGRRVRPSTTAAA